MSVHYKFKSALDYDTVTFDGLHISVGDLKAAISQQKRIGKTSDFDLQITNAQTKEVYTDDSTLIPKNTSLLVARIPLSQQPKKQWEGLNNASLVHKDVTVNKGLADLSRMEGSEQDKINAMISQSTFDYDPSNYLKIRGQNQRGTVPSNYICYKCQKHGHWIKDCPLANAQGGESVEIRRSTGIPRSFMVPVDGPKAPGAMMTPSGTFAVPVVDHEAYLASENAGGGDGATVSNTPEPSIPDELICSLCHDLLTDAVMIPCCGNSFCDECIRGALLESEDHECPDCREKEISPGTLIPNRFLRNSVSSFRNQTGYSRRTPHRPAALPQPKPVQEHPPVIALHLPPNGQSSAPIASSGVRRPGPGEESDGSQDDNITVTVPPCARRPRDHRRAYGPPSMGKSQMNMSQGNQPRLRMEEQRASTPTVDERRDPISSQPYNRGPPPYGPSQGAPPSQRYNAGYGRPPGPHYDSYPLEPYQPPPPGIKDSPSERHDEDPLEAFNRMIREKEARAKRREEERRRLHSPSPRARLRSPRLRSRSPPPPRSRSRSPPPPVRVSPVRASSRLRYSRSRSISRGRRRSPWSPRRRRTRERTLSLTRSPSPRRRHRSPLRYRSPLRSPPPRSPPRGSPHSLVRSPHRSPHHPASLRSPRSAISPQRYIGVYDELLSPTRRSVEPLYGPRYGPRNHGPPPSYPPIGMKPVPPMGSLPIHQEPPGYRGRYDGPQFDEIPPGVDPPIPGYEPSPFEKPPLGPPVTNERERLAPMNYRESYRPPPYVDGPSPAFRDLPPGQKDIPLHLSEPQRFRESYRGGPAGPPYRDQGPVPYRDGQSFRDPALQQPYREPNFRGGPPPGFRDNYRNNSHIPYRDGGPSFRENPLPNFREGPGPYRPPSVEPREVVPPNYHDPNFRDGYREIPPQEHIRSTVRPNNRNRGGPRRNLNVDHERHKENSRSERDIRDRERYNENRELMEKNREPDKKVQYERTRDDRIRDYDRNRDYIDKDRERDRDHEKSTPEKMAKFSSPKRSRTGELRDKRRSESRGRSRERDKRDKKEERNREKSSTERSREHKEKDRKLKERDKKKKKREKETEKRKKRDKKEKKEKEMPKQDDVNIKTEEFEEKNSKKEEQNVVIKQESTTSKNEIPLKVMNESVNKLYGEEAVGEIDKEIIKNYVKKENEVIDKKVQDVNNKEETAFDGIELQVTAEELDLKVESENNEKEMLAPVPELSKWEVDEDNPGDKVKEPGEITSPDEEEDRSKITSEVIKRAENAIFAKTITSLRPIEIKKISNDRAKLYTDESKLNSKNAMNNIQVTVPVTDSEQRSVEVSEKKNKHSKTPPRLSVKDRLGGKVDEIRRPREDRIVQSAVARVKSKSKTPKRDQPYRRVTVDRDRGRRISNKAEEGHRYSSVKGNDKGFTSEALVEKDVKDVKKSDKKIKLENENIKSKDSEVKNREKEAHALAERERKRSVLDEAHFEPDYDENVESDNEVKEEANNKKRERSKSPEDNIATKKTKTDEETIKLDLTNVKKKPETGSESSSDSSSSSSSSEEVRKRKRKRKRSKRKKKRVASDSESESDSSSDDHKKKKKKRKHKKKSSKKKKKSKHK